MADMFPGGPGHEADSRRKSRWEKVREEVEANRRGEYAVPTWVLFLALVAMLAAFAGFIIYANSV